MATGTPTLTQCPSCGARIARPELSLCSYCGSPVRLQSAAAAGSSATGQRLARMREHPEFGSLLEWTPEDPAVPRRRALLARGALLGALGLALVLHGLSPWLFGPAASPAALLWRLPTVAGAILLALGAVWLGRGFAVRGSAPDQPVLKRPALVSERRSVTSERGAASVTDYFFTLEFEDGATGEFRFPGRGGGHDLLVPGNTGLAFTRGADLLEFVKVRV